MADTRITLNEAMGITKNMTPEQVSDKWIKWSAKYPDRVSKLSPAVVTLYNTLATIISIYNTISQVVSVMDTAVKSAKTAYDIAMSMVPGLGSANASKLAVGIAADQFKGAVSEISKKISNLPQMIYDQATNIKVEEDAII